MIIRFVKLVIAFLIFIVCGAKASTDSLSLPSAGWNFSGYNIMVPENIDSLLEFIKQAQYDFWKINKPNYIMEPSASALVKISFRKNFSIRKIIVLKRSAYNNNKFNYDKLILTIIKRYKGKWKQINRGKRKSLAIIRVPVLQED
jgi:hypothetical protein